MIKMSITDQLMEIYKKKVDGNSLVDNDGGDSKVKTLYSHFISLTGTNGYVYISYISDTSAKYTIDTLKTALAGKSVVCSGYIEGGFVQYISEERGSLMVGIVDPSDGSNQGSIIDNTFSISDSVSEI